MKNLYERQNHIFTETALKQVIHDKNSQEKKKKKTLGTQ